MLMRRKSVRAFSLFMIALMLTAIVPFEAQAVNPQTSSTTSKLILDNSDKQARLELIKNGATQLEDYGSFSLWKADKQVVRSFTGRSSVSAPSDFDTIGLRAGSIDTSSTQPNVPTKLSQSKISGKQLWLVQFYGPIKQDWRTQLEKLGVEFVIYMPNNAYVVWLDGNTLTQVEGWVGKYAPLQWAGPYQPAYRLSPRLQGKNTPTGNVNVTIQFYNHPSLSQTLAKLATLPGKVIKRSENILNFVNVTVQIDASELTSLANLPEVYNVEPWVAPRKLDEVQDQIISGNITTSGGNVVPSGTGYLGWLSSKGFPTTASSYPIISVVDDGLDNGSTNTLHPDFHTLGVLANPSRITAVGNCTTDATGNGVAGHGNINTGIVGSYNNLTGSPHQDANGYRLDLGVSPYGQMSHVKIFTNDIPSIHDISNCGDTDDGVVAASYAQGAPITSNSWGSSAFGAYDASAQAYDSLTRDASAGTAGNQQMLHVFSAGNAGPGASTVGSPGTAKNVITVGATENVRDQGISDGCATSTANNADDIIGFSSRGPTTDLRAKPDIVAPGVHIQGPASQDPGYDGSGVCGGNPNPPNKYYPAGQTLYTWSSGTSHSTPAVAGAASLVYNYYNRVLNPGQNPSPAMLKGLIVNTPRYLNGVSSGDTLPSPNQGWGDVNLAGLTDGTPRILVDQTVNLTATGQTYNRNASVVNNTKPLRITLVWTDAPGSTTGNSFVNNLDLEVTAGGQIYKGNVFSGGLSTTGGSADTRNNVENVFLPAGVTGSISVKVTATNLAGDGVPGIGTATDQDFALAIYNANTIPTPSLTAGTPVFAQVTGNGDSAIDQGETWSVQIPLINNGDATATGITSTLAVVGAGASMVNGNSVYPNITPATTQNNTTLYTFTVALNQACGNTITFTHTVGYGPGTNTLSYNLSKTTGTASSFVTYNYTGVPVSVPDNNPAGATATITIPTTGTISAIRVRINDFTHSFDSDMVFSLIGPDSTTDLLINRRGSNGDNFTNTVLDDSAASAISAGIVPFTGSFKPESPLSIYQGKAINGVWTLKMVDKAATDLGTLNSWSIDIQQTPAFNCNSFDSSLVVTKTTDDGTGLVTGSLSKAILNTTTGGTISFTLTSGTTITVTGALPTVPNGVTINGGSCTTQIEIKAGNSLPAGTNGLTIGSNTNLKALYIHGFPNKQLVINGLGNKAICVKISKT